MNWYRRKFAAIGTIFDIASEEREKMMDQHVQEKFKQFDYLEGEEKQEKIEELAEEGKYLSPAICETMSKRLTEAFVEKGYNAKTIYGSLLGNLHAWTELNKEVIVDITADQFGAHYPDVLITTYSKNPEFNKKDEYMKEIWDDYLKGLK